MLVCDFTFPFVDSSYDAISTTNSARHPRLKGRLIINFSGNRKLISFKWKRFFKAFQRRTFFLSILSQKKWKLTRGCATKELMSTFGMKTRASLINFVTVFPVINYCTQDLHGMTMIIC